MESGRGGFGEGRRVRDKADVATVLRKSWYRLRLSVRDPARVFTWDAIVLTAASPEQAELYEWQLDRAKRIGCIAGSTVTLTVPDPDGQRIGSGAATLNAIGALAKHFQKLGRYRNSQVVKPNNTNEELFLPHEISNDEVPASHIPMIKFMTEMHVLLVHAGGDSKRLPWANPMGKAFLPLPYLASYNPDGPVPLLFDHIIAISSCMRKAFKTEGGLLIMTGDVLPCFDASSLVLPMDSPCVITVPVALDIAQNHGVVVASGSSNLEKNESIVLVENLLQKPTVEEIFKSQAVLPGGKTLLDTGLIAVRGRSWFDLVKLALCSENMVRKLLSIRKEMSLYEDVMSAWVPEKHDWLRKRPIGSVLIQRLGMQKLYSYCACDFLFLHFGTSTEFLDHLTSSDLVLLGRRHLSCIPEFTFSEIAPTAIILSSKIGYGVSVGEDSVIYDSSILRNMQIGSRSIVVGIRIPEDFDCMIKDPSKFILPNRTCLWEVPLLGYSKRVVVYCGLHDNPKNSLLSGGTFCGRPWKLIFNDLGINENDLWDFNAREKCFWNAKLFPVIAYYEMLLLAMWLMGVHGRRNLPFLSMWRGSYRVSLEELHRSINYNELCKSSGDLQSNIARSIAKASINCGLLGRNMYQLCDEILLNNVYRSEVCKIFLEKRSSLLLNSVIVPKSRLYQVQADLLCSCGYDTMASELEPRIWASVAEETALSIKHGYEECSTGMHLSAFNTLDVKCCSSQPIPHRKVKIELPARVDFVGGWSDTPPWSLERNGYVLNMAIALEGACPIGAAIETTTDRGLLIIDDGGRQLCIRDLAIIEQPFNGNDDPFRLVKSACLVAGLVCFNNFQSVGLRIETWAKVPRGSGLGTSSILAAAVLKGLLRIMNKDDSNENVTKLVLLLEQVMGTGGGWQDQIGGLYPGIKLTAGVPGAPLSLHIYPLLTSGKLVTELQQRLIVVFTGQVRLAREVLQKVVTRYLRHDNVLISSIKRLAELAKIGREALMNDDVDELGSIMLQAWELHQELDPYCSNEFVDRLFAFADPYCCGYKLVGAGGGGFALLLARDVDRAKELRRSLEMSDFGVRVYDWSIYLETPTT